MNVRCKSAWLMHFAAALPSRFGLSNKSLVESLGQIGRAWHIGAAPGFVPMGDREAGSLDATGVTRYLRPFMYVRAVRQSSWCTVEWLGTHGFCGKGPTGVAIAGQLAMISFHDSTRFCGGT